MATVHQGVGEQARAHSPAVFLNRQDLAVFGYQTTIQPLRGPLSSKTTCHAISFTPGTRRKMPSSASSIVRSGWNNAVRLKATPAMENR